MLCYLDYTLPEEEEKVADKLTCDSTIRSFDVFSGLEGLSAKPRNQKTRRGGPESNFPNSRQNRRLNSDDLGNGGKSNPESDMSSEDFDNADDYADQLGELEEKSDRLADDIND